MMQRKNNGFRFLDFLILEEKDMGSFEMLAGSYAILQYEDKFLLCFNKWRNQWEIPAGSREGQESAKQCAIRELYEETGQQLSDMTFRGLLKSQNIDEGTFKYNPVYFAYVDRIGDFVENEETSDILLWDMVKEIGTIDEVDARLLDYLFKNKGGSSIERECIQ
ncbi:NUDIX hydrolase [Ornithinibacillus sp. FSL M8-0202]|uniref:NUDIX hydrolase n=1 Tax=Ornithinibacillus sp. FSL M8-0202 TaxID=2921616 RepID=UPI0030CEB2AB